MFGLGTQELLIIFLIVLLLFGATRIPQIARAFGKSISSFKRGLRGSDDDSNRDDDAETYLRASTADEPERLRRTLR